MNVSPTLVKTARRLMKDAPEKADEVRKGEKSLHQSASELPTKRQPARKPKEPKITATFESEVWNCVIKMMLGGRMTSVLKQWHRTRDDAWDVIRHTLTKQKGGATE